MEPEYSYRGYLPHLDQVESATFITVRLGDALPREVLERIIQQAESLPESKQHAFRWREIERSLDQGWGRSILRRPETAAAVESALKFGHGEGWYDLLAWVVMPNHLHFLIHLTGKKRLGAVMQSLKSYTSRQFGNEDAWQSDYFDRAMRDAFHSERTCQYIEWNPVKANLVIRPTEFRWSSAHPTNAQWLLEQTERDR